MQFVGSYCIFKLHCPVQNNIKYNRVLWTPTGMFQPKIIELVHYCTVRQLQSPPHCVGIVDRNVNAFSVMELCHDLLTMLQCCDAAYCVVIMHRLEHGSIFALGLPLFLNY